MKSTRNLLGMKGFSILGHAPRSVLEKGTDYEALCRFYATFPEEDRYLNFTTYFSTICTAMAQNILQCDKAGRKRVKNILKPQKEYTELIEEIEKGVSVERKMDSEMIDDEKQDGLGDMPLNLILYGPPGTGKTYKAILLAAEIIERRSNLEEKEAKEVFDNNLEDQIVFITFHQNYSYEDFVQGIGPDIENDTELKFKRKEGVFKRIVDRAKKLENTSKNYVIIIDEINRANISRVFGELITLIEPDKRMGGRMHLKCTLPSGDIFEIPSNLYIIGTMNTADKSIALLDIALRRRFEFEAVYPMQDVDRNLITKLEVLVSINKKIAEKKNSHDFGIGHSYFMVEEGKFVTQMNKKVIPLLLEYFMNDEKEVREILVDAGFEMEEDWPLRIVDSRD